MVVQLLITFILEVFNIPDVAPFIIQTKLTWTFPSLQLVVATHAGHSSEEELRDMILRDADPTMENVIFLQSQRSASPADTINVFTLEWIQH